MQIIQNPQEYDKKLPTNVRLVGMLKTRALEEAKNRGTTLAQVINEALMERYNVEEE